MRVSIYLGILEMEFIQLSIKSNGQFKSNVCNVYVINNVLLNYTGVTVTCLEQLNTTVITVCHKSRLFLTPSGKKCQ